ncbi:MAG: bifunctional UDP-N-acetylglucosamine diphosphorylase/glucosamine-1-phosphate N-acetyltransferase GlmU [Nitrospirae bacterium]|nr:bifunctional UDP-N-acetylglucosamine diphosphorylase/glucosamine-1-phosphate N-acetyltransferase GlmU [Nitrospirota bacterium]
MSFAGVILAGGLGKRMKSSLPKVLHTIYGYPMIQYVLDVLYGLNPEIIIVVAGKHLSKIKNSIKERGSTIFVKQEEAKGTADALLRAVPVLKGFKGTVVVVNGDTPLIVPNTLKRLLTLHKKRMNVISLLSFFASKPDSYGRVIRNKDNELLYIVEDRDATEFQKKVNEVNSGVYAIESEALSILEEISPNKSKGEYYLTDMIGIARNKAIKVDAFCIGSEDELIGVNTMQELEKVRQLMRERIIKKWIDKGVNFMDTSSVFISPNVRIGKGTFIYPNVYLEGNTRIGKGCYIYPNVRIYNSIIGEGVNVKDSTLIEESTVKSNASIGPFARIRPNSIIGKGAKIGNFVEVKKSVIGSGTKAGHLTYLGDSKVGNNVNIGAGTITCNYDGYYKHTTFIEDDVFIGSDSQLIAPVRICKGAYIGAGSTITNHVPSMSLALSRVKQKNIKDWVIRRRIKFGSENLKMKRAKSKGEKA